MNNWNHIHTFGIVYWLNIIEINTSWTHVYLSDESHSNDDKQFGEAHKDQNIVYFKWEFEVIVQIGHYEITIFINN